MRRITGAAALGYVVLAAVENMELLGAPGLGASNAAVQAAFADTALRVVTTVAGALSLACYVAFAALAARRWLPAALTGAGVARAGVAASTDPARGVVHLALRDQAGPVQAVGQRAVRNRCG